MRLKLSDRQLVALVILFTVAFISWGVLTANPLDDDCNDLCQEIQRTCCTVTPVNVDKIIETVEAGR